MMKYNKMLENNETNKNSFLVACVCSILFLLTLCYFGVSGNAKGTHSYINSAGNDQLDFTTYSCDNGKEAAPYYLCGDANGDGNIDCRVLENQCIDYTSTTTTCTMLGSKWKFDDFVYSGESLDTLTAVWQSDGCFNSSMSSSNPNGESYSRFYEENCVLTSTTTNSAYNYCVRSSDNSTGYCTVSAESDMYSIGLQHCDVYKAQGYTCEVASFENYTCASATYEDADATTLSCSYSTSAYGKFKDTNEVYVNRTILGENVDNSYKCPCPGDVWTTYGDASCVQEITENESYYSYELGDLEKCYNGYTLKNGQCVLNKYVLTYDGNGGTFSSGVTIFTAYADAATGTTTIKLTNGPSKSGATFKEWNTKSDGTGTGYSEGANMTISKDTTLYAIWQANAVVTYTVTYNANGGSGAPSVQTTNPGVDLELSSTIPTRSGYTFDGWNSDQNGNGDSYEPGATYEFTSDVTLYAQWKDIEKPKVPTIVVVDYNTFNYSATDNVGVTGYYVSKSSTAPTTNSTWVTSTSYDINSAGTYYVWAKDSNGNISNSASINVYEITYNANGGNVSLTKEYILNGASIVLPTPTREDYTFNGWYTEASGGTKVGTSYKVSAKMTLYAQWTEVTTTPTEYLVDYDGNGGTVSREFDIIEAGKEVTLPTATRSGYTFNGWYTAVSGGTKVGNAGAVYKPGGHVFLYAQWTKDATTPTTKTFKVTFDANGGTLDGDSTATCSTTSNSCDISVLPRAMKSGYTFTGWGTSKTCTNGIISTITVSKDETYYACYILNNVTDPDTGVDEDGNVTDNVQTGEVVMALVWFAGLFAIGYSIYYFKKIKQN